MIANLITLSRVFLVPVYLLLLFSDSQLLRIIALLVFAFASFTDYLDGLAARLLKQESEFGKFLDPLADKLLVIGAMCGFLYIDSLIPVWMVVIVVARDVLVTLIRSAAMRKGSSIRTTFMAKTKTAFQMVTIIIVSIVFIIQPPTLFRGGTLPSEVVLSGGAAQTISVTGGFANKFLLACSLTRIGTKEGILLALPYWLMLAVTIFTALSGVRYLVSNGSVLFPPYGKKQ